MNENYVIGCKIMTSWHIAHLLLQDIPRKIDNKKASSPRHHGGCKKNPHEVLGIRKCPPQAQTGERLKSSSDSSSGGSGVEFRKKYRRNVEIFKVN